MNTVFTNTPQTREELKRELAAVLGDIHFLEMLINDSSRIAAIRRGATAENADEAQFADALKRIADIRERLEKK